MKNESVTSWDFCNPVAINFGVAVPEDLPKFLAKEATILVTSPSISKFGITEKVEATFKSCGIELRIFDQTTANPNFLDVEALCQKLIDFQPAQILAIGGGSVLDLAKILSYVLAGGAPSLKEIWNAVRAHRAVSPILPLPMIAVPTTAGTGSEVTPFATLWDSIEKRKYSLTTPSLFPKMALLDPRLSRTLPWETTLATGLDALAQALESVWNKNYTPLTGTLAERAVKLVFEALPILKDKPQDLHRRAQMLEASLFAGICISRTRTAISHAISYPLTAHFGTPHGIACAFTLPEVWNFNFLSDDGRMRRIGDADFGESLKKFLQSLDFAPLFRRSARSDEAILKLCPEMWTPGRSDNSLRELGSEDLKNLLQRSLKLWH